MNIAIGIISYLPNFEQLRIERIKRLKALIKQCDEFFNLPILVIAQNWQNCKIESKNLILYHYPKLGIVNARKELRKQFLETNYDYIIMLDDDCIILGNCLEAKKYINTLKQHPNGYGLKKAQLLKLAAFSKNILKQIEIPEIHPEKNEGFEDCIFVEMAKKRFPNERFFFTDNLLEISNSAFDQFSVWRNEYKDTIDVDLLYKNTQYNLQKLGLQSSTTSNKQNL